MEYSVLFGGLFRIDVPGEVCPGYGSICHFGFGCFSYGGFQFDYFVIVFQLFRISVYVVLLFGYFEAGIEQEGIALRFD